MNTTNNELTTKIHEIEPCHRSPYAIYTLADGRQFKICAACPGAKQVTLDTLNCPLCGAAYPVVVEQIELAVTPNPHVVEHMAEKP